MIGLCRVYFHAPLQAALTNSIAPLRPSLDMVNQQWTEKNTVRGWCA